MWKDRSDWHMNWEGCVSLTPSAIVRQSGGRMTPAEGKSRSGVHAAHRGRSLHQTGWQPAAACIPHSSHRLAWDLAQLNNKRLPEDETLRKFSVQCSSTWPTPLPTCCIFCVSFCSYWKCHLNYWAMWRWCSHESAKKKYQGKKSCSVFHYARIHVDLS